MVQLIIDQAHSEIIFTVKHMMFSKVRGSFDKFSGTINLNEENVTDSSVEVEIDPSSINTRDENRDNHLRSQDFFGVEQNPAIIFKSTKIEPAGGSAEYKVHGDLTMNGVTKAVVLDTEFTGKGVSPMGPTVYGFAAQTTVNRKDFNMNWNAALEAGGVLVSDEVKIEVELQANPAE